MKDENFLKANNARSLWHPMTAPSDSLKNPPAIIVGGSGTRIRDIDGHEVVDGVGGLTQVTNVWNLGFGGYQSVQGLGVPLPDMPDFVPSPFGGR